MKRIFSIILIAFVYSGLSGQTTWESDKAHSQLSFGIVHMGISEVEGKFDNFSATIVSDEEDFSDALFELEADVTSINTGVGMRDDHLRSDDFFDVKKYPEMTFKSSSIEETGEDKYRISGDLNLHGVTQPVILEVWYRGTVETKNGPVSGFQITGVLKRSDFKIGSGFPAPALSDEVSIKFDGEFKKKQK